MRIVAFHVAGSRGNPFHSSKTVFFMQSGTIETWLNEDGVWCVSLIMTALSFCKSTINLGLLSFRCNHCLWPPGCRCTCRNWLDYAQGNISFEVLFDLLLPMVGNQYWCLDHSQCCLWDEGLTSHGLQRLVWTCVE